jgi:hypothetical protein
MFLQILSDVIIATLIRALASTQWRLQTYRTATDAIAMIARFESFLSWHVKLIVLIDHGHPVTEFIGVVHAVAIGTRTFDEWCGTEIFQTGTRT